MSRRKISGDLEVALAVRRLQEQAAMVELKDRMRAADAARERLGATIKERGRCEGAWMEALQRTAFDPGALHLWRAQADAAAGEVNVANLDFQARVQEVSDRRHRWDHSLRLVEAVGPVARAAARNLRRADDERRLRAAEDAGNTLRRRR